MLCHAEMKSGLWSCLLVWAPFLLQASATGSAVNVKASTPNLGLVTKHHVEEAMEILMEKLNKGCGSGRKELMKAKQRLEEILLQAHFQSDHLTIVHDDVQTLIFKIRPGAFRGLSISDANLTNAPVKSRLRHSMYFPTELVEKAPGVPGKEMRLSCIYLKASCLFEDGKNHSLLNDDILGAMLGNISITNLSQPVQIKFWHNHSLAITTLTCVFWLEGTEDSGLGSWSQEGCTTNTTQEGIILCQCNHLTYFAVLLETSATSVNKALLTSLIYITDIGCSISASACLFTIIVHIFCRHLLREVTAKIHVNFLGALFLLNATFLVGKLPSLTGSPGLCRAAAVSLHYALLSCLTWMAIEGFHLYVLIVRVYNSYISHYLLKLCSVGWGIPGLAVLLAFVIKQQTYGIQTVATSPGYKNSTMCWITSPLVHYLNVLYFSVTILFNMVVLTMVVWTLRQLRSNFSHQGRTFCKDTMTVLGLTCLLGATWTPALLFFNAFLIARIVSFTVLNSLQGLFICLWYWAFKCHSQRDTSVGSSHSSRQHTTGEANRLKDCQNSPP